MVGLVVGLRGSMRSKMQTLQCTGVIIWRWYWSGADQSLASIGQAARGEIYLTVATLSNFSPVSYELEECHLYF